MNRFLIVILPLIAVCLAGVATYFVTSEKYQHDRTAMQKAILMQSGRHAVEAAQTGTPELSIAAQNNFIAIAQIIRKSGWPTTWVIDLQLLATYARLAKAHVALGQDDSASEATDHALAVRNRLYTYPDMYIGDMANINDTASLIEWIDSINTQEDPCCDPCWPY